MPQSESLHVIESGDTLGSIASRYWERFLREEDLAKANPHLRSSSDLRWGDIILIPESSSAAQGPMCSSLSDELSYISERVRNMTPDERDLFVHHRDETMTLGAYMAYLHGDHAFHVAAASGVGFLEAKEITIH